MIEAMWQIHQIHHKQKKGGTFLLDFINNGLKLHRLNSNIDGQIIVTQQVAALAKDLFKLQRCGGKKQLRWHVAWDSRITTVKKCSTSMTWSCTSRYRCIRTAKQLVSATRTV